MSLLFLTHRDDVAGHERFAERFGCERVLHRADLGAATRGVERILDGDEPLELARDLVALPTPGHTPGSTCLWVRGAGKEAPPLLFSGDHLDWSERHGHPMGFRDACWHSWPAVIESTKRLAAHPFEWLLPGHGAPGWAPEREMPDLLQRACGVMAGR